MVFMILGDLETGETEVFTVGIKILFGILTKIIMLGTLVSTTLIIVHLTIMDTQIHTDDIPTDTIIVITEIVITGEELHIIVHTTESLILRIQEIQQLEVLI